MTREEELVKAARVSGALTSPEFVGIFLMGAEWADEHPKSPWKSLKDEKPQDGQLIAYAYLPDRSTPNAPVMYGTIYYPEPPLTDVMDYWMPLADVSEVCFGKKMED